MSRQSSLAIYSPIFSSHDKSHGGITSVILGLVDGLADMPVSVLLLVRASTVSADQRHNLPQNVTVHLLGQRVRPVERMILVRWLRRHRPDALLTAGYRFNLIGLRAARAVGVPAVASVHNHLTRKLAAKSIAGSWIRQWQMRTTYPWARALATPSEGVAKDLRPRVGTAAERVITIPNPVLHRNGMPESSDPEHPWLALPRSIPVAIAAGRLTRQKDYPTLLAAMDRLRHTRACRLIILGDGEERSRIERTIRSLGLEDHVALAGFRPDVLAWIRAADVFVLSSAWEGFGNVIVEALAVGTPVVSTDCESGPREILEDGDIGPLVPVGDERALAEAIVTVLDTPPPRSTLVNAAQRFRSDRIARRYLEVLGIPENTV